MDKVGILCAEDRRILREFSGRCNDRLSLRLFFVPEPFLRMFLTANVNKEAEKDGMIIEYAAARRSEGRVCGDREVDALFDLTKETDRAFLRKVSVPSFSLAVNYEEIGPIRKARIALLTRMTEELLSIWEDGAKLEEAVRTAYREHEFKGLFLRLFELYTRETRILTGSLRLFGPRGFALDAFADALERTMEEVGRTMAEACGRAVFHGRAAA